MTQKMEINITYIDATTHASINGPAISVDLAQYANKGARFALTNAAIGEAIVKAAEMSAAGLDIRDIAIHLVMEG